MLKLPCLIVMVIALASCTPSAPPIIRPPIWGEPTGDELYASSLILPGTIAGESWREVALKIDANPPRPGVEFTNFMLKHPKDPIEESDLWQLTLSHFGYNKIAASHRGELDFPVLELRSKDIVPIGTELYLVTFDPNDDFITVKRITEKLADRFKLSADCACFSTNLVAPRLMAKFEGDVQWSDTVRLDEFSAIESSVEVSTRPVWAAPRRITSPDEWTSHTLQSGGDWTVRGFTYQVLSIVPPQDIAEGHVVGWLEFRLKEKGVEGVNAE